MRPIKKRKKIFRISSYLERTSLVNKGYYFIDEKTTFSCGTRAGKMVANKKKHRIHFTLTARAFAQIIGQFIASATMQEIFIKDNRPKVSRKYYFFTLMPYWP